MCDPCSLGSYAADENSTACAECPLDTVTGIVTGRTNCTFCKDGEFRDDDRVYCSKCEAGKYKTLSLDNLKHYCAECPPLKHAVAGSTVCKPCSKAGEFPDTTGGICLSCAIGSYRGRDAIDDACSRCPPRGVRCEDSSLQVSVHSFHQSAFDMCLIFLPHLSLSLILRSSKTTGWRQSRTARSSSPHCSTSAPTTRRASSLRSARWP